MITCPACNSDVRVCPVCEGEVCENVNGSWFHPSSSEAKRTCVFGDLVLTDAHMEYLAQTKAGFIPRKWTACQFCAHFVGAKKPDYNQNPCGYGQDVAVRAILKTLARMDRCPLYEKGR